MRHRTRGFTIVELLVVVSIIALLLSMLLPAVIGAREGAQGTVSQANLRQLAVAHQSYASEWSGRQLTYILDGVASYGDTAYEAFPALQAGGVTHPSIVMGYGYGAYGSGESYARFEYILTGTSAFTQNVGLAQPIVFNWGNGIEYMGSFRMYNAAAFNQYVSGRFYDPVFYAPKDTAIGDYIEPCFNDPGAFCIPPPSDDGATCALRLHPFTEDRLPAWSSYAMSPAAMFAPEVMARDGWRDPWSMGGGFRSPTAAQALYPDLKTHMIEHNWLQSGEPDRPCNPGFYPGNYGGCEPYFFNHSWTSSPFTAFYDGHVGSVGVRDAVRADGRARTQTGAENGLWVRDTPFGEDGYLSEYGYDQAQTSFHVLTADGIRGRDIVR